MTDEITNPVKCHICGCELEKEDCIEEEAKVFCEDCFIEAHHKIQVWILGIIPRNSRKEAGLEGTGQTELQTQ